jgi:hypothetical protein
MKTRLQTRPDSEWIAYAERILADLEAPFQPPATGNSSVEAAVGAVYDCAVFQNQRSTRGHRPRLQKTQDTASSF